MLGIEDRGEVRSIVGPDFALAFARSGDRWTHAIELAIAPGGPRLAIARSVEWDAGRDDPDRVAGPVFQELHFQDDPGGMPQALLVGMSGPHHFSAVFTMTGGAGGLALDVDVVDRCRPAPAALASTYTASLRSGDLAAADDRAIAWDIPPRRLAFAAGPGTRVGLAEAGRAATRVQALADPAAEGASPTRRWRYRWEFSPLPC